MPRPNKPGSPARARAALAAALVFVLTLSASGAATAQAPSGSNAPLAKKPVEQPIARLGDETITLADLDRDTQARVYDLKTDAYALIANAVNALVDRRLLEREAKQRDISVDELERMLAAEATPATDADVDVYLAQNPGAAAEPAGRVGILNRLNDERRVQARAAFVAVLREGARFKMLLHPPEPPRGRKDAPK